MSHPPAHISPFLAISLALVGLTTPALAHKTIVAGDIAGTWHVEPNHTPKAGEPAIAWVALTREGGAIVPLSEANCQMQVYAMPRNTEDIPILEPPVKAIAAEQYEGIPGVDIVFPKAGLYQLELACTPVQEDSFAAFHLHYDVTVAAGNPSPSPSPSVVTGNPLPSPDSSSTEQTSGVAAAGGGIGVGGAIALVSLVGVGGWLWSRTKRQG